MARGKPGRGSDQFPLRLPDGMRDRIAEAADQHGRSMNAEIVAALEIHFPEPFSLETRIADLLILTGALKQAPGTASVENLIEELEKTIEAIATGRAPELGEEMRDKVNQELQDWEERKYLRYSDRIHQWMDEAGESPTYGDDK